MASLKEAQATTDAKAKPATPSPNHPRPRKGKTAKDKARGAQHKNEQNKQARASWQQDSKQGFPFASCNGKRNRYQVTGKGNETVFLRDSKR